MFKLCDCGCGNQTAIAKQTNRKRDHIKGEPLRFIRGHNSRGGNHNLWNGGKYIDSNGYVFILSPNHPFRNTRNYIREHIIIMERYLRRYIRPPEEVHHINGIKSDNSIGNLILFKTKKDHLSYEARWRAYWECGDFEGIKCWICKKYDKPENMKIEKINSGYHQDCKNRYKRERRKCQN